MRRSQRRHAALDPPTGGENRSYLGNEVIPATTGSRVFISRSCARPSDPPLRSEPYVGSRLNENLDDQARRFLASAEKNRFDPATATLHLSPIFKWYDKDFITSAGSLAAYAKPFLPVAQRNALIDPAKIKVSFMEYDWTLNELKRR